MGSAQKIVLWAALMAVFGGISAAILSNGGRLAMLRGAVIQQDSDPRKQAPIADVEITTANGLESGICKSDSSGFFRLSLLPGVKPGQLIQLQFRHPDFQPLDLTEAAGDKLYVARMAPLQHPVQGDSHQPEEAVANVVVRYSKEITTTTNIGNGVKTFEVLNSGNLPCNGHAPCSPDGKWKARVGSAALDAGLGDEFRNATVACIAGPCPFTKIDSDGFSKGGRTIKVSVRNWSDTTTFLMQAEVFHTEITDTIQSSYPVILGRAMDFTLPAAAQGPSIEAVINGQTIIFPFGTIPSLSWANCEVRIAKDKSKTFHCKLKPGYRFR